MGYTYICTCFYRAIVGHQACLSVVVDGHAAVGELLATADGRRELESMFNLCVPNSLEGLLHHVLPHR